MGSLKHLLVIVGLVLAGIVLVYIAANKTLFDLEENRCDMTYMYEYPEYIKVNLKKKLSEQFPRYNLYIYGEGYYAEELRRSKPTGIPVLFIPGNAGSHRQVRSLASVALRKAETKTNHFNYFTVDFDEDLGGIFGGVLMEQAKFVHSCLRHILRMYKENKNARDSVVIIGHSMGGLIARALYSLEGFQPRLVHFIITLGTPHIAPVLPLETGLTSFYNQVNNFWKHSSAVNNVTIVSFSGGSRDILVPAQLSSLHHVSSTVLHHSTLSTSVPHVWLTIDHLALCWCKQLVLVINRALFDMIDSKTGQIMNRKDSQHQILTQYFGYLRDRDQSIGTEMSHEKNWKLPSGIVHHETFLETGQQHTLSVSHDILIPCALHEDGIHFVALTRSVKYIKIHTCKKVEEETCIRSRDMPFHPILIGHTTMEFIHISAATLAQCSHIVVSTFRHKLSSSLLLQFITKTNNKQFRNFGHFAGSQTFPSTNNLFTNISLPVVQNIFDVFLITVKKTKCEETKNDIFGGRVHIPWLDENVYANPVNSYEFQILLKLHTPKPFTVVGSAHLHIWNSDKCALEVKVQYQFGQTLGQIFKVYAAEIPQWMYFWIMAITSIQIEEMSKEGNWLDVWSAIVSKKLIKIFPLFVLIASEIITRFLKIFSANHALTNNLPYSVINCLWPYDWLLPKGFIILIAFDAVVILHLILKFITSSLAWFMSCCISNSPGLQSGNRFYANLIFYGLFGSSVLSLSFLCSPSALYVFTVLTLLYSCRKAKEYNELVLQNTGNSSQIDIGNQFKVCETMLLLFVVICIQSAPAFISWLKVFHSSWSLPNDPFFLVVLLLTPTVMCLLQMELKKPPEYLSLLIFLIWCVGFSLLSLDKLPHFIGSVLLVLDFFVFCKPKEHCKTH